MKNDIILFSVLFAVAWIGFSAAKDHLGLSSPPAPTATQQLIDGEPVKTGITPAAATATDSSAQPDPKDQSAASTQNTESNSTQSTNASTSLTPTQAVEQVLATQSEAWNRGDLDEFMAGYWNDPNLTFSGGGSTTLGWEETHAKYRQRYPVGAMGKIQFSELKTEMVGEEAAIVTGSFQHQLPDEDARGNFSLVLRKIAGDWKITHDHTSLAK